MKVYKLKKRVKYKLPKNKSLRAVHNFRMYINKRNFKKTYGGSPWLYGLRRIPTFFWLILFYYALIGLIILLSKLGVL